MTQAQFQTEVDQEFRRMIQAADAKVAAEEVIPCVACGAPSCWTCEDCSAQICDDCQRTSTGDTLCPPCQQEDDSRCHGRIGGGLYSPPERCDSQLPCSLHSDRNDYFEG